MSSRREDLRCSIEKKEKEWRQNIDRRIAENSKALAQMNERTIWMMRLVLGLLTSLLAAILIGSLM